jgi:hypothetical protein
VLDSIASHILSAYVEPAPSRTDPPNADDLYRALGIAVVAWGRLEGHFFLGLITILNIAKHKEIPKKPPMKWDKQRAVWNVAFETVPSLVHLKAKAEIFISEMYELSEHRNKIVHGLWGLFNAGEPLSINVVKVKAQSGTEDGLLHDTTLITVDWLVQFAQVANRLNLELMSLTEPLVALRTPSPDARRL